MTVITGPMFSGKSIELIRHVNRLKVAGKRVIVFNFSEDMRYTSTADAASKDGLTTWAVPTRNAAEISERVLPEHEVVVVDEVQFFDDATADLLLQYADEGREVLVAGLNLDFRGEPFVLQGGGRSMADLLVRADHIHTLSAICTHKIDGKVCGAHATRTQRLRGGEPVPANDPLVQVGAQESYEARCRQHHFVPK